MTVLVTGATGLLGNAVVRALLDAGREVRALVREGSDPRPLSDLSVERALGDVRDGRAVEGAVRGADAVVHAAAVVDFRPGAAGTIREVNVGGTRSVAEAALRAGARLVHVSSVDALGWGTADDPADESRPPGPGRGIPYCDSKREAETVVLDAVERGLDAVTVNPAFLLGPRDWKPSSGKLLLGVARGRGRVAPPGGNDFCHSEDVATGVVSALEKGRTGRRYILGGEALSYREAFGLFARVTGGPAPLVTAPGWAVRAAGRAADALRAVAGRESDLSADAARAASHPHHFDDRRARRELGYRSRSAEEAARDAWRWFVENGYAPGGGAVPACGGEG